MSDDRYDVVTWHGKRLDKWTVQALEACERALGYELTITQGGYNAGRVSASAGTHDGGGVVDLAPFDAERKVRVLRQHGFAAWHRLPSQGPWNEHVHAVLVGNLAASASAERQVTAYLRGLNGLANGHHDDGPRGSYVGQEFTYRKEPELNNVQEIKRAVLAVLDTYGPRIPRDRRVARAWVAAGRAWLKSGPKA